MLKNLLFAWGMFSFASGVFCAMFLTLSFLFWQPEGMFWYGLGLIASGMSLKLVIDKL